ncbi:MULTISPECIES: sarcosine oxidase subunit gamma [Inquilinus]|uniref:Sarcosine oxidase subunit gamma n=1 Tax=Inquilinus ginsengisoli TaxID=363840 RepID=A0ABU1JIC5_9PROT|nr:sarcosine oxidase subunit gamma family protein [Inquilinus ginsengisoli]MDR6288326.1 sarcosine oxidase subunit gamma [Inquilinus ginsengisoli]
MSDLTPRSAFAGILVPGRHGRAEGNKAGVTVRPRDGLALARLIARKGRAADLATAIRSQYGLDLPTTPKRVEQGGLAFVWSGPGQWLAVAEDGRDLVRDLAAAVGAFAAVSDQSDGLAVLRVSGPHARDALVKGVGLDLHPRGFGPDDAAVTVIAHVGAQLWQLDDAPTYEIAVLRGFAGSVWRWLDASAAEFGCEVEA